MPFFFVRCRRVLLPALLLLTGGAMSAESGPFTAEHRRMVDEIARMARDTGAQTGRAVFHPRVMAAMEKVPRHRFVPAAAERNSYDNRPLAIGLGQTISQPYIVALMSDLMDLVPSDRVLEIGTGSGYQAAVLAELSQAVFTIEIVEALGREAAARLKTLGYGNVRVRIGDGHRGWPSEAPFDAIMVTAAARELPTALLDQLKPGGRLVIPIGERDGAQTLYVYSKSIDGKVTPRQVLAVRFVPMTGGM